MVLRTRIGIRLFLIALAWTVLTSVLAVGYGHWHDHQHDQDVGRQANLAARWMLRNLHSIQGVIAELGAVHDNPDICREAMVRVSTGRSPRPAVAAFDGRGVLRCATLAAPINIVHATKLARQASERRVVSGIVMFDRSASDVIQALTVVSLVPGLSVSDDTIWIAEYPLDVLVKYVGELGLPSDWQVALVDRNDTMVSLTPNAVPMTLPPQAIHRFGQDIEPGWRRDGDGIMALATIVGSDVGVTVAIPSPPKLPTLVAFIAMMAVLAVVALVALRFYLAASPSPTVGGKALPARDAPAEESVDLIGRLSGGVAHDFNNLLTVILGNLDPLLSELPRDGVAHQRLRTAIQAALRGAALTRQLLAFARQQPLEPRSVDAKAIVQETASLLSRTLGESIEVVLDLPGHPVPVWIDPTQLQAAVVNLALNARDAMPGGGRLTLFLAPGPDDEKFVELAVSDTGSGIPAEILSKVIEPFFTTKSDGQSTGLGLSMVYGFVRQSGGRFAIDSTPGTGTRVTLYLPPALAAERATDPVAVESEAEHGSEHVLVVEDDPVVRFTVVSMLIELGYRVSEAGNGREALDLIEGGVKPDLLFTDVIMPGEVTARALSAGAQAILPDLKVLYTSGYTEDSMIEDGMLEAGVVLLPKPYRPTDLARRVRDVLDGRLAHAR